jgi:hypothetical protein
VERVRDDPREERRLHEHEQCRADPEGYVDGEQHSNLSRPADETRVERAHG